MCCALNFHKSTFSIKTYKSSALIIRIFTKHVCFIVAYFSHPSWYLCQQMYRYSLCDIVSWRNIEIDKVSEMKNSMTERERVILHNMNWGYLNWHTFLIMFSTWRETTFRFQNSALNHWATLPYMVNQPTF